VRAPGAILSTAALLWGFVQAPFFHIHPEDFDHPAPATLSHVHVRSAPAAPGPAISALTADDDAVDVEWGIARVSAVSLAVDLSIPDTILIPAPTFVSAAVQTPQQRGHDPPELTPKQSRAPPA
jgi:hypothetical protein